MINSFDKTKFSFFILYPLVRVLPVPCVKETLCDEYIISQALVMLVYWTGTATSWLFTADKAEF